MGKTQRKESIICGIKIKQREATELKRRKKKSNRE